MTIIIANDFTVNSNTAVWNIRLFRRNGVIIHNHHLRFNDNPETGKWYRVPIYLRQNPHIIKLTKYIIFNIMSPVIISANSTIPARCDILTENELMKITTSI